MVTTKIIVNDHGTEREATPQEANALLGLPKMQCSVAAFEPNNYDWTRNVVPTLLKHLFVVRVEMRVEEEWVWSPKEPRGQKTK